MNTPLPVLPCLWPIAAHMLDGDGPFYVNEYRVPQWGTNEPTYEEQRFGLVMTNPNRLPTKAENSGLRLRWKITLK